MKRWTVGGRSAHSIVIAALAAACIGCLCILGVAQALTAESQSGSRVRPGPRAALTAAPRGEGRHHRRGEGGQTPCEQQRGGYCPQPPLYYRGNRNLQHKPWLFPIFWGSNWNTKGAVLKAQIIKMYKDFSGSAYQGIITQYFDSSGHIESTIKVVQPYVDERVAAPSEMTKSGLETEVSEAISTNSWPSSLDGQYIVLTAPGSTYHENFLQEKKGCAFHNKTGTAELSYSFVAYVGEEPYLKKCDEGNINGWTMAWASHEYAESATDPFIPRAEATWNAKKTLYEISDLCENGIDELPDGSWVQGQWDNYKNECAVSDASPAYVYAIGEPAAKLSSTTATLRGFINPENLETIYNFEYGTTPSFGTKSSEVKEGPNWETKLFAEGLSGLTANTAYYYVLVGKNSKGVAKSRQQKFITPSMFESKQQEGTDVVLKAGELRIAGTGADVICVASEIKSQWHIETNAQIKQAQKEATKGLDLLLQVKNWGKCSAKVAGKALASEIKECDIRVVQDESGLGYGGVVTPCLVKIGTEGKEAICEMQIPAGMETEAESDEGINVGLKEIAFDKAAPLVLKVNMASGGLGEATEEGIFMQQAGKHLLCPLPAATEEAELVGMEVEAEGVESP